MKKSLLCAALTLVSMAGAFAADSVATVGADYDIVMGQPSLWWAAPLASILALMVALLYYKKMMAASEGNQTMKEIAGYVREGAMAYLFR